MSKWEAYPEWATMVKINYNSMYCSIIFILLSILLIILFKKTKKDNKILLITTRVLTYVFFISTIISRIIVEMNVYNESLLYYLISMGISILFIIFISLKQKDKEIVIISVMAVIIAICFFSNDNEYPKSLPTNDVISVGSVVY